MPLSDIPSIPQDADQSRIVDYLIMLRRKLNDFLNHLDTLNVDELDAQVINTGVLNAALVTIKSLLNAGAYIQIDGNGMKIFDGVKNTFIADVTGLVTMTGALIQSASAYPRVELNSANSLFGAYQAADKFVKMDPTASGSTPGFTFQNGAAVVGLLYLLTNDLFIATTTGSANIQVSSGKDLYLSAQNVLKLTGASLTIDNIAGYTGSISYVKNVVSGTPTFGTISVTKGIITNAT